MKESCLILYTAFNFFGGFQKSFCSFATFASLSDSFYSVDSTHMLVKVLK